MGLEIDAALCIKDLSLTKPLRFEKSRDLKVETRDFR